MSRTPVFEKPYSYTKKKKKKLRSFKVTDITTRFLWVPGHSGILRNEKADLAATKKIEPKKGRS